MAKAPTPGVTRQIEIDQQVETELSRRDPHHLRPREQDHELEFGDLGPARTGSPCSRPGSRCRRSSTRSASALSVLVLWWTMLRRNGKPNLPFAKVEAKYRDNRRFAEAGFTVEVIDADGHELGDDDLDYDDDDDEAAVPEG